MVARTTNTSAIAQLSGKHAGDMVMVALALFPRTVPNNLPHNSHILTLSTLLFMSQILVYAECTLAGVH